MNQIIRVILWVLGIVMGTAAVNFSPMLSLKTPSMTEYQAEGIRVFAEPKDSQEVQIIAEEISKSRDRVIGELGSTNAENIDVIIYPDGAALKRKTLGFAGMLLPAWYIGKNTGNHVMIVSPAKPGPQHSRESIVQAAVHEYVHVLTDRENKSMGYWLKEGFALYLAGQKPTTHDVISRSDITWEEFSNPNAIQFSNVGGYYLAWAMMLYLEESYGWETVLEFLEPGNGFPEVTGRSMHQFFTEWKMWLAYYDA